MFDLSERVALVTGASRGIGAAVACALASRGAHVAVGYRSGAEVAAAVVERIRAAGGRAEAVGFDVADPEAAEAAVKDVAARHGRLDILVNNAGIARDALLLRQRPDDLQAMLATNLVGTMACAKAALRPMMKARFGRIIQMSSVIGESGNAGQSAYAATKAALLGFTRSLALEVASREITVNAVTPGLIDTDMTADLPEATRAGYLERIPLGRLGRPADVAAAVVFLASPEAGYVTGQVLRVNGGLYL